jgi:peptidoglycan-N-acetylglucosamine deacetylase
VEVALTFDTELWDRPTDPGVQEAVAAILAREGVRATFFLQGRWVDAYPALARRLAADGHLIGNHSHWHAPMSLLTDRGIAVDLEQAGRTIARETGIDPRPWFRCPFGDGHDDRRVLQALEAGGYRAHHWDVDTGDWRPAQTAERLVRQVLDAVDAARGEATVVLLHTWSRVTLAALPELVSGLRRRGARPAGLDELERA